MGLVETMKVHKGFGAGGALSGLKDFGAEGDSEGSQRVWGWGCSEGGSKRLWGGRKGDTPKELQRLQGLDVSEGLQRLWRALRGDKGFGAGGL